MAVNILTEELNRVKAGPATESAADGNESSPAKSTMFSSQRPDVDLDSLFDFLSKMQETGVKTRQKDALSDLDDIGREVNFLATGIQQRVSLFLAFINLNEV